MSNSSSDEPVDVTVNVQEPAPVATDNAPTATPAQDQETSDTGSDLRGKKLERKREREIGSEKDLGRPVFVGDEFQHVVPNSYRLKLSAYVEWPVIQLLNMVKKLKMRIVTADKAEKEPLRIELGLFLIELGYRYPSGQLAKFLAANGVKGLEIKKLKESALAAASEK